MGLFRGLWAPVRGLMFISREHLWRFLIIPMLLNAALSSLTFWGAWRYFQAENVFSSAAPALRTLGLVFFSGLLGAALFLVAHPVLDAIFCDKLSERVEHKVRGTVPAVGLRQAMGQALGHGILKSVLYGLALLVGLVLGALTGVGGVIGLGLGLVFLAYDGFDYPLARRGATFGGKWRFLALHPGLTIGYGLGTTLLYFVPLAIFVAPAISAAGATLVYLDVEKKKEARRDARKKAQVKTTDDQQPAAPAEAPLEVAAETGKGTPS